MSDGAGVDIRPLPVHFSRYCFAPELFKTSVSDTDNILLKKIARASEAIEEILKTGTALAPTTEMDVIVLNFPVSFEVSNFPAFPASFEVSNFPAFPTSFEVSNFPAFPASFGVNNFPASFGVNNFPASFGVNNFPATQPVSAAALPLPSGAATEATLLASVSTNFGKTVNYFALAQGATGNTLIAAASPGNRHKVVGFLITSQANATVQFFSSATAITGVMDNIARGNLAAPVSVLEPSFQTSPGESLNLTSTGSAAKGFIAYITEP
jgi:hypothetical protein